MKALKCVGYTTPGNIWMIGICPGCGKSFSFHSRCFYMADYDATYSDDGQDRCQISAYDVASDYRKFPENKKFGVCGCLHLGRKMYTFHKES